MRKDPRYALYRYLKSKRENEDVLKVIEEEHLLKHLGLLQVSKSNKSIEVKFDSEQAAQYFVDCDIWLNSNSWAFWRNAQRQLRVSIHGEHPNIPDALWNTSWCSNLVVSWK